MTEKKLTAEEIAKRLTPTHLDGVTTESIKEDVEKASEAPTPEEKAKDPSKDPRARNPYVFPFSWTDSRGKKWEGNFTTHYPTPLDLLRAGTMQSRLLGGAPKESLDALTDEIAFIVSRLSFSLDDRPDFEQFFRQYGTITPSSQKKPGN